MPKIPALNGQQTAERNGFAGRPERIDGDRHSRSRTVRPCRRPDLDLVLPTVRGLRQASAGIDAEACAETERIGPCCRKSA
jgi:hypothetical protein